MNYANKKTGFTLIELIIVIVLTGILALFLAGVIRKGVEAWYFVVDKAELITQTPYVLNRLAREIRTAQNITSALSNSISFVDSQGNTITYTVSSGILYRNGNEFLDGVVDFSLQYSPSSSNIKIVTVTLERNKEAYSILMRTGVKRRN
ncbi:MAG: type II secretion system protein J [Candidatus Omnitrophota bacterium]